MMPRRVLITGGTGSFGHAFTRRLLTMTDPIGRHVVERIVIYSRDELKQAQMRVTFPDERMRFFVGDVRDRARLTQAMRGIDDVVHAAAMKRIETCEAEPGEAIATNVLGTENVALAAIKASVRRAVFLSTDKAPAAHTLYGATKFCAERYWLQSNVYAAGTVTRLSATRYGNVLGSRGSVIDFWRAQMQRGEPLTLTSADCTRFWMTIDDAVDLVLLALEQMRSGEVFVPKIRSSTLLDLARAVAMPDGVTVYAPGHIETGLRPGERVHETLISLDEARTTSEAATHYIIDSESRTWDDAVLARALPKVAPDFTFRSDTAPRLSVDELRRLIA